MIRRANPRLINLVMPLLFAAGSATLRATTTVQADERRQSDNQRAEQAAGDGPAEIMRTPWDRFLDVLVEHDIPHDPEALETAALRAMLHAVDRHAKLLSAEEAQALRLRESGLRHPSPSLIPDDDAFDDTSPESILPLHVETWPHDIAYIKINGLYENSGARFTEAVTNAAALRGAGLIIDLRHAGGRDFDAVDRIAAFFVDGGTLLYELQTPSGNTLRKGMAHDGMPRWNAPALVLTGNRTVQAAELLASILRETRGVMLLGNRTRGDPKLRELYRWSGNHYLYLPTTVIRPACHDDYTFVGVVPHIHVRNDRRIVTEPDISAADTNKEKEKPPTHEMPDTVTQDPLLARAVDILIGLEAIANFRDSTKTDVDKRP